MRRKLHFGCGRHEITGWENFDHEVDISKPLPFADECASHIYTQHVVEHIAAPDAWRFFQECYRVLDKNGVIRVAVPSITRANTAIMQGGADAVEYLKFGKEHGFHDGTQRGALEAIATKHGHQSLWTYELLEVALGAIGFTTTREGVFCSMRLEMRELERHGVFREFDTIVVEGVK